MSLFIYENLNQNAEVVCKNLSTSEESIVCRNTFSSRKMINSSVCHIFVEVTFLYSIASVYWDLQAVVYAQHP